MPHTLWVRRVASVAGLLAVVLLAACDDDEEKPALSWSRCPDAVDLAGSAPPERLERLVVECAVLEVPLDHVDPSRGTVPMAVARAHLRGSDHPRGTLVLNPGGPGQSGLDYLPGWAGAVSDTLLENFDLVSFDPRGTGRSDPVNCGPLPDDDQVSSFPDLGSPAGFAAAAAYHRRLADSCTDELGDRAPYFNTEATARDLELLRKALGDPRLTYAGFSYGARLGGEYARRYPDKVRALVLDGPSDPTVGPAAVLEEQTQGFEHAFDEFARDCATRPACVREVGEDARAFTTALVARANAHPIPSGRAGDELPATGADVLNAASGLLFDDATWPVLAEALGDAAGGDSGMLFEAFERLHGEPPEDPDAVSIDDAMYVINCNDRGADPSDAEIVALARRFEKRYPLWGAWASWNLFGCSRWQPERTPQQLPAAPTAAPILVVGTVHDPATPYVGAQRFARALGSGHLLTWEGEGHTAYLQSECITRKVDNYLIYGTLPGPGERCPA